MKDERMVLHRDELYKQVWKEPMTRLAKKYGISDRGLAKICHKLNVPVPPRGYWAKVQSGVKVPKTRLPRKEYGKPVSHEIQQSQDQDPHKEEMNDDSYIPEKIKKAKKIVPQKRLHNPHPLVRRTRAKLEKCKPDKYGAIGAWGKQCLDLRIAPNSIDRALRIMDSLIKAFEKYGYTVGSDTEWNNHPNSYVMIFGEKVKFSIYEGSIQSLDKKWNEDDYFSSHHKYKYRMSGKLQFQLDGPYGRGIRNKWSDTVRKQIEDCLRDVLIGAIKLAHFACAERERREEEARRWEEERIRRAEEQRRHEEEMKRRSELENQALSWNKSKQLRKFIAEVERKVSMQMCSVNDQTRMIEWLAWAKEHADRIDPLYDNLPFEVDS